MIGADAVAEGVVGLIPGEVLRRGAGGGGVGGVAFDGLVVRHDEELPLVVDSHEIGKVEGGARRSGVGGDGGRSTGGACGVDENLRRIFAILAANVDLAGGAGGEADGVKAVGQVQGRGGGGCAVGRGGEGEDGVGFDAVAVLRGLDDVHVLGCGGARAAAGEGGEEAGRGAEQSQSERGADSRFHNFSVK